VWNLHFRFFFIKVGLAELLLAPFSENEKGLFA